MSSESPLTVVCVEPDADRLAHTRETLESAGDLTTVGVRTVEETLDLVTAETVDCVVTALDLPDGDGLDLMRQVREKTPETGCILYSERSVRDIETGTVGTVVAEYIFRDLPDAERRLRDLVRNVAANRTQIGYPVSDEESDRLAALDRYDVDYLARLETFDRMTRLARAHFDVSVAFVGLIEDREERFIACHGADWERLAREDSICTWAMLENDMTVIEDVQADDRFAEGGLGVFALDPEAQDRSVLHSLGQLFDGRVEVRDREACEVRVTGVPGQPDGWVTVE